MVPMAAGWPACTPSDREQAPMMTGKILLTGTGIPAVMRAGSTWSPAP
jgi:hypothetical protein